MILSADNLAALVQTETPAWVSVDTETYDPYRRGLKAKQYPAGVSIAFRRGWKPDPAHVEKQRNRRLGRPSLASIPSSEGIETYYLPVREDMGPADMLMGWVSGAKRVWMHNAKFDTRVLATVSPAPRLQSVSCTLVLAWLLDYGVPHTDSEGRESRELGLKSLAKHLFDKTMVEYKALVGAKRILVSGPSEEDALRASLLRLDELLAEQKRPPRTAFPAESSAPPLESKALSSYLSLSKGRRKEVDRAYRNVVGQQVWRDAQADELTPEEIFEYAEDDARQTLRLAEAMWPEAVATGQVEHFDRVERRVTDMVRRMEDAGVGLDKGSLGGFKKVLGERVAQIEHDWNTSLSALYGYVQASIRSATQCRVFFDSNVGVWPDVGLPKTKTGAFSVNKETLKKLVEATDEGSIGHTLAKLKLEHSEYYKLLNTYTDTLLDSVGPDGRIHPSIRQEGTMTGRFSCREPNLTAQPKSRDVRSLFVPAPGNVFVCGDWKNLEVYIMAHFSKDPVLVEFLLSGADFHSFNAEKLGIDRHCAKTTWFCLQYGGGSAKVARLQGKPTYKMYVKDWDKEIDVGPPEVRSQIKAFKGLYQGLFAFKDEAAAHAKQYGYVLTLHGRRRYLTDIWSHEDWKKAKAERQATSTIIQGSAADIAKVAGLAITDRIAQCTDIDAFPALQIHDEWLVECPQDESETCRSLVQGCMEDAAELLVPLKAEVKIGKNWAECK